MAKGTPTNLGFRIERIWAYVAVATDGDEGICGFQQADGTWVPMIGADKERVDAMRPMAEMLASVGEQEIRLVSFACRVDKEEVIGSRTARGSDKGH